MNLIDKYLGEGLSRKKPKDWVEQYMENMFDNGEDSEYKTWKEFFQAARSGAYDWSEDLYSDAHGSTPKIDAFRNKILKVSPSGFKEDKEFFEKRKGK